jgi:hypothetical protein
LGKRVLTAPAPAAGTGSSKCRHKFALRDRPAVTLGWELSVANGAQKIMQLLAKIRILWYTSLSRPERSGALRDAADEEKREGSFF